MTRKLIDAEAAKAAIENCLEIRMKGGEAAYRCGYEDGVDASLTRVLDAIDALPDASEQAQQAGDGAEEE